MSAKRIEQGNLHIEDWRLGNILYSSQCPIRIETLRNIAFVQKPEGKAPNHQKDRGSMLSVNVKIWEKDL
ncbi:MAG: hypothetical protein KME55_04320 [Nostoc indistinguendum CM1-VF10]|nr:hypothetical protein [Nostoc indistinguendum CM1-VF10]